MRGAHERPARGPGLRSHDGGADARQRAQRVPEPPEGDPGPMRPVTRALVCLLLWSALTACGVWGAATGQGPKEIRLSADPPARKRAVEGAGDAYDVHGGDKVQIRVVAVAPGGA